MMIRRNRRRCASTRRRKRCWTGSKKTRTMISCSSWTSSTSASSLASTVALTLYDFLRTTSSSRRDGTTRSPRTCRARPKLSGCLETPRQRGRAIVTRRKSGRPMSRLRSSGGSSQESLDLIRRGMDSPPASCTKIPGVMCYCQSGETRSRTWPEKQRNKDCKPTTLSCWICSSRETCGILPWSRKSSSSREFLRSNQAYVGDLGHRWRFIVFSVFAHRRRRRERSRSCSKRCKRQRLVQELHGKSPLHVHLFCARNSCAPRIGGLILSTFRIRKTRRLPRCRYCPLV
mmetsp:Transcript_31732/g.101686  ORF Transcript_31732/g.101686 Transcript_31732/m.101686 type:complete len:288 (-) Transcript_31732:646-1509(-)